MKSITVDEFKCDIDYYISHKQQEEIAVTKNGEIIFYITPKRVKLLQDVESLFGCLPREAYTDADIDRE